MTKNLSLLRPIQAPRGLTGEIVARLTADIMSGKLLPGSRLPTEQEMIAATGVSRTVIREAVAALRADKLVVSRQGIGTFSWYIYRVTTPALRNLFMGPRNVFRVEEALLSLLAGDVFRPSPIKARLKIFKAIYYMNALLDFKRNYMAWRKRRQNVRTPVGDVV